MSANLMKKMGKTIGKMLPSDFGYAILVFPFKAPGTANYVSNANRLDMIKALREAADRLERKQDFQTPDDNVYSDQTD